MMIPRVPKTEDLTSHFIAKYPNLVDRHLNTPPTIIWEQHNDVTTNFDSDKGEYYTIRHPFLSPRRKHEHYDDSFLYRLDMVFNQIFFTLATWGDKPLAGSRIQSSLGSKGHLSYQSSVSSTLQSAVEKGLYEKFGKGKQATFAIGTIDYSSNIFKRLRFIPSERAISIARRRAQVWRDTRNKGLQYPEPTLETGR